MQLLEHVRCILQLWRTLRPCMQRLYVSCLRTCGSCLSLCTAYHAHHCPPSCRSRVAVLYTVFSLACALALLLFLSELFNYPLGLKVCGKAWKGASGS